MNHDLIYGLEIMALGFFIVLFALFLLALILMLFSKVFEGKKAGPKQVKGGPPEKGDSDHSLAGAKQGIAPAMSIQGDNPEVVAAAMGALLFSMEQGQARRFTISKVTSAGSEAQNNWAQTGRSRLLQLRQDFALSKRGKSR